MYRKRDREQMTVEDFIPPFGGKLNAMNRWVIMSQIVPWDMVEDIYAENFKDENADGRPPISSRMATMSLVSQSVRRYTTNPQRYCQPKERHYATKRTWCFGCATNL